MPQLMARIPQSFSIVHTALKEPLSILTRHGSGSAYAIKG
jgi:hypothetical protein